MPVAARWIRLWCVARLRSAGWLPWLLVVCWIQLAAAQEPVMLRNFGIRILDQGAWVAGVLVLAVLLCERGRPAPRTAWGQAAAGCMLALIALVQAVLAILAALAWKRSLDLDCQLHSIAAFVAAWCGPAMTLAPRCAGSPASLGLLTVVLLALQILLATVVSVRLWTTGWTAATLASIAIATATAFLARICDHDYAWKKS